MVVHFDRLKLYQSAGPEEGGDCPMADLPIPCLICQWTSSFCRAATSSRVLFICCGVYPPSSNTYIKVSTMPAVPTGLVQRRSFITEWDALLRGEQGSECVATVYFNLCCTHILCCCNLRCLHLMITYYIYMSY